MEHFELSNSDKTSVLLYALDFNLKEINHKEDEQQKLFEWSTGLLLASFAAIVALAGKTGPLAYPIHIKSLATGLIVIPTVLLVYRIITRTKDAIGNAMTAETVENLLHLFDEGYYGTHAPFPKEWRNSLAKYVRKDKLPAYYAMIIMLMTACVVTAIWLLL